MIVLTLGSLLFLDILLFAGWGNRRIFWGVVLVLLSFFLFLSSFLLNTPSPGIIGRICIFASVVLIVLLSTGKYYGRITSFFSLPLHLFILISFYFSVKEILILKEKTIFESWYALPVLLFSFLPLFPLFLKRYFLKIDEKISSTFLYSAVTFTFFVAYLPSKKSLLSFFVDRMTKTLHDIVHTAIITLSLPDHPYLFTPFWKAIGVFFKYDTSLFFTSLFFTIPFIRFVFASYKKREWLLSLPDAYLRKKIYEVKKENMRKVYGLGIGFFFVIVGLIKIQMGEIKIFDPVPFPVSPDENGDIVIKIGGPPENVADGFLHKFVVEENDELIRFLVIKKPDGSFGVCLDACEICEPEGYAQLGRDLFCKYCGTPIPLDTVGIPGGCNPIPLKYRINGDRIIISLKELKKKYQIWVKAKGRKFTF